MFWQSFKITSVAVAQSFLLAAIGYFLVKKNILKTEGLNALSRLVIEVTLPLLIFCQLISDFKFSLYPDWWIFPLLSMAITAIGLLLALLFSGFIKGPQHKLQFLSLVTFQNSGYLPLVLSASLLPQEKMGAMFIYLFLFLSGFNVVMFSLGVHIINFHKNKKFELGSLFSPPVVATIISLLFVASGLNHFVAAQFLKPLRMIGDCTLPLAMFVVGGSLAEIHIARVSKKAIFLMSMLKLVVLPAVGIFLIIKFQLPELIGLLIVMQLAMPPATLLSVITRHYNKEDLLISQGILIGHIISIFTIPVFLSLYFMRNMLR
ncbi:MAG: AEC family transporter [Candidatus Omnitrophota bacterium]